MTSPRARVQDGHATAETSGAGFSNVTQNLLLAPHHGRSAFPFIYVDPRVSLKLMRESVRAADMNARRRLAREFAARAREVPGVREVRLTKVEDELVVTALTDELDMDRDLSLQRLFRETAGPGASWTLRVRPYGYNDSPEVDGELL